MNEIKSRYWATYDVEGKLTYLRIKVNELVKMHNKTIGALVKALKEKGWEDVP